MGAKGPLMSNPGGPLGLDGGRVFLQGSQCRERPRGDGAGQRADEPEHSSVAGSSPCLEL